MPSSIPLEDGWVPDACTLPTVEQPLRRAEFDDLFAHDVLAVHRDSPQRLRLELAPSPEVVSRVAGLAARETGCCSFFAFDVAIADGTASLTVETGPEHEAVLAALAARAQARIGTAP
jgi:hypothetical protein